MVRICLYVCMHVCTHIKRSLQAVAKWLNKGKYIHHTLTQVNRRELTQSRMFVCVCVRVSKRAQVLLLVPERSRRVCLRSIDSRSVV